MLQGCGALLWRIEASEAPRWRRFCEQALRLPARAAARAGDHGHGAGARALRRAAGGGLVHRIGAGVVLLVALLRQSLLNAELEQRVRARTAELAATNRELETFAYSVSHDLKSPLRGIDGFSALLEQDFATELPPDGQRYLGTIRRASQQMSRLIDDLLE
jgi:signal transduction histidine kinase